MMAGLAWIAFPAFGQDTLRGVVFEEDAQGRLVPLVQAHVYWQSTSVGTATGPMGSFAIPTVPQTKRLVVRYLGLAPDTLFIRDSKALRVILKPASGLAMVEVSEERASSFIQRAEALSTKVLTEAELFKAACCNLSESFETNPSVEVSYTDAASGVKQIQLLGLSGSYVQMLRENMPTMRGLGTHTGLSLIPGTWIDEIQLTQGPGSVVNGFEAMSGQVNLEFKKPNLEEPLVLNGYLNQMGRSEVNAIVSHRLLRHWTAAWLLHGNRMDGSPDVNKDGFLDLPTGFQANGLARFFYDNQQGLSAQINLRRVRDQRQGGQLGYNHDSSPVEQPGVYGLSSRMDQGEVFGKLGYVFPAHRYRSLGLLWSMGLTDLANRYGWRNYSGRQESGYVQGIYQDILGSSRNRYRVGWNLMGDRTHEQVDTLALDWASNARRMDHRMEWVPGLFGEFTLDRGRSLWVLGGRVDYHNRYGWQFSPRIHWKSDLDEKSQLRIGVGRGFRVASIWAENQGAMVSSRALRVQGLETTLEPDGRGAAYGLNREASWYTGLHYTRDFRFRYRSARWGVDLQQQWFTDQVIADYDRSPGALWLYNQPGRSWSRSVQVEMELQPMKRTEVRLAYRLQDVRSDYLPTLTTNPGGTTGLIRLLRRPMVPVHRAMVNVAYRTKKRWEWDATMQVFGSKRIPFTASNPQGTQMPEQSPAYAVLFLQVTKNFKKGAFYIGVENLGDFRQRQLILDSGNPFSPYFDASLVWGPAIERMVYVGFRARFASSKPS